MKKFMNFFLMATLVALCVGFSSCSKDDEGDKNDNALLIGTWESTDGELTLIFDGTKVTFSSDDFGGFGKGESFRYEYFASEKELFLYFSDDPEVIGGADYEVYSLTDSELVLENYWGERITYKKK